MPPYAKPTAAARHQPDVPILPKLRVDDIARFNNWDKRECAVSNAPEWRARVHDFIKSHNGRPPIPKKIHQIWIGDREPPCIWLDSWRIDFLAAHGEGWDYTLWDNDAVADMRDQEEMANGDLFDRERMWQCKADLLRLELLYRYGGVYIDADMVSLGKSLDDVLDSSRETGFGVSYEADTKDKPYSVLGNSIIFASKGHPLLLLLIKYIKVIYDHKRPYFGVEWVTGPLAFTKALLFSDMPLTMIPRDYFYAAFQYIPNPSAIDTTDFPHSLGFQFGYTCSGLGDWVKSNNKCKQVMNCTYHKNRTDYPLGAIKHFVNEDECVLQGDIPKVIHQFCFSKQPPTRWIQTWKNNFCSKNPGWTHKLWDYESLAELKSFFCAHLYPEPERQMDDQTLRLLALEILFKEGGYYVPLTTVYEAADDPSGETSFPPRAVKGMAAAGTIVGSVKSGLSVFKAIKGSYHLGKIPKLVTPGFYLCSDLIEMHFPDACASYLRFATGSRFLGAGEIHYLTQGGKDTASASTLKLAYDAQVPWFPYDGKSLSTVASTAKSAIIFTDSKISTYPRIFDSIAGLIYQTENYMSKDWDFIVLALEWGTGEDKEVVARAHKPFLPKEARCLGLVVNVGRAERLAGIAGAFLIPQVLAWHSSDQVYVGTVKFAHSKQMSAFYASMSVIQDAFLRTAGHVIPSFDRDETQTFGNMMKGMRDSQVAFEIILSDGGRIMYRSFNDDGAMNSETRIVVSDYSQVLVEYARVYFDHKVVFDGNNILLSRSV